MTRLNQYAINNDSEKQIVGRHSDGRPVFSETIYSKTGTVLSDWNIIATIPNLDLIKSLFITLTSKLDGFIYIVPNENIHLYFNRNQGTLNEIHYDAYYSDNDLKIEIEYILK